MLVIHLASFILNEYPVKSASVLGGARKLLVLFHPAQAMFRDLDPVSRPVPSTYAPGSAPPEVTYPMVDDVH